MLNDKRNTGVINMNDSGQIPDQQSEKAKKYIARLQYGTALASLYYFMNGETYSSLKMALISLYSEKFAVDLLNKMGSDENMRTAKYIENNYSYISRFSIFASDVATKLTYNTLNHFTDKEILPKGPRHAF